METGFGSAFGEDVRVLAKGASSSVLAVRRGRRGEAIKILHSGASVGASRRFANEADALSRVKHPNVIRVEQVLGDDELQDPRAAHHIDQRAPPGAADAARNLEHVVDVVDAGRGEEAAHLQLLGEAQQVGSKVCVLVRPPLAGDADTALDLVENQQRFTLVGYTPQRLQELRAKVVVAAFALDRLAEDCGDSCATLVEGARIASRRAFGGE